MLSRQVPKAAGNQGRTRTMVTLSGAGEASQSGGVDVGGPGCGSGKGASRRSWGACPRVVGAANLPFQGLVLSSPALFPSTSVAKMLKSQSSQIQFSQCF